MVSGSGGLYLQGVLKGPAELPRAWDTSMIVNAKRHVTDKGTAYKVRTLSGSSYWLPIADRKGYGPPRMVVERERSCEPAFEAASFAFPVPPHMPPPPAPSASPPHMPPPPAPGASSQRPQRPPGLMPPPWTPPVSASAPLVRGFSASDGWDSLDYSALLRYSRPATSS